ncbi:MAG TPA: GumC family protein [Xanthobacteraceae bacterium]|nr:GumC family protein [Xanthobacteraceae bacterium]
MNLAPSSPPSYGRGAFTEADFELAALGAALWRQRLKVLRPTIAVALITFLVVLMVPSKYQSETRVLVVDRDNIYLRPDADKDLVDRNLVDQEAVTSQAQLILSRDLAKQVIAKLKLNELPEFDPALGGVSLLKSLLGFFGIVKNPMSMTPEERVLEAYYDRLSVYPVEKSRVIVIDFLSENPELAARVANAIADAYLERQQVAKQDQARSAGAWLSSEIDQMRKKVADAEAKVEAFRAKSNLLIGPNNTTLSVQQLGDLNAQLAAARAQKADAAAKARLIRGMLNSGETIESSDILNSELIRRLSEQRVTLRAQLAEQASSLLDNHPRIKELKAQINDLDQQIRKEAETIARSLENDAKLADAKVEAQLATFDQLKSQAVTSNEDDVQLRALERDAKSQRDLLESYLAKYREASARDAIASAPPDARIISRATVSTVPAYPKKLPTVLIASIATMVLCSGMILTRELLVTPGNATVNSMGAEVRLPRFGGGAVAPTIPADAVTEAAERAAPSPATPQSLTSRIASVVKGRPPVGVPVSAIEQFADNLRQVGFAGSQMAFFAAAPGLDVGRIAIKFARALSREARVVLVGLGPDDAAIKQISSDGNAAGLADLAAGTASFRDIITKDKESSLNLIFAGREVPARDALLAAPGMAKNFEALALTYAHVIINAGLLAGANTDLIARLAPHAVLLVDKLSDLATAKARDGLMDAGFEDVTILVAGRSEAAAPVAPPAAATAAAA